MYDILFVDDDEAIGFIVSNYGLWKESNYRIRAMAGNGKQAIELLEKNEYDLVITDIRMPVMDGLDLIRYIRSKKKNICVMLASTYNDFEYVREGLRLGAIEYIEKPFTEEKLKKALEYATRFFEEQEQRIVEPFEIEYLITEEIKKECFNQILWEKTTKSVVISDWLEGAKRTVNASSEFMASLLTKLLQQVWEEIIKLYPWIGYLESMDIRIAPKDYEKQYEIVMDECTACLRKYQLKKPDQIVNQACEIIYAHCLEDNVMEQLIEEIELSKDYIGKLFRSSVGMTLNEYLTVIKMEEGKKFLKDTNMKVYEISEKLGYSTVDYFTRLFRNYTGSTPMQYKKTSGLIVDK
ncbi:response regulator transcription factor [Anaerosporobacter sp.]|uniref:response regulator transcription factor n=1 Tax=Anaerosporobacter sp. TaxID=1872529 RepID=UPI00286F5AF6|nr:response regulator [Anaerosporobacter sp.]